MDGTRVLAEPCPACGAERAADRINRRWLAGFAGERIRLALGRSGRAWRVDLEHETAKPTWRYAATAAVKAGAFDFEALNHVVGLYRLSGRGRDMLGSWAAERQRLEAERDRLAARLKAAEEALDQALGELDVSRRVAVPRMDGLTKTQSRLVEMLAEADGRPVSMDALVAALGSKSAETLRVHVCHIRKRRPDLRIVSDYAGNYCLEVEG